MQLSAWKNGIARVSEGSVEERKAKAEQEMILAVSKLVRKANDSLNISGKMNAQQITDTAEAIVDDYWMYSFQDLSYFFRLLVNGTLGELYGRFDQNVVMSKLKEFDALRDEQFALAHKKQKQETGCPLSLESSKEIPESAKKALNDFHQRMKERKDNVNTTMLEGIRKMQEKHQKAHDHLMEHDPQYRLAYENSVRK